MNPDPYLKTTDGVIPQDYVSAVLDLDPVSTCQ